MGYLFCELMCLGLTGILPDLMSSSIKNLFLSSPGMTTECKPVRGSFPYGGRFMFLSQAIVQSFYVIANCSIQKHHYIFV